jgi:hypothetical protein
MPDLFPDLPEQHRPTNLYSDRHMLTPCTRCGGTGREDCPYPRHYYVALAWDPTCRGCGGAGRRLVYVGTMTDA